MKERERERGGRGGQRGSHTTKRVDNGDERGTVDGDDDERCRERSSYKNKFRRFFSINRQSIAALGRRWTGTAALATPRRSTVLPFSAESPFFDVAAFPILANTDRMDETGQGRSRRRRRPSRRRRPHAAHVSLFKTGPPPPPSPDSRCLCARRTVSEALGGYRPESLAH